ncbi:bifunctional UDP-N-acetylglucosamine diphosphorylase/glucosamine-1-phosphate N-acetyltransferase GlmU [Cognatishimia sp. MH4019]|uniref:bifunctional UDP-N-acetylglucosamine diphosphorylase/glucosamine-1-phosphate N-acetyltransferase GlmU n=1 Tax=Cognatishimia sp. MH4019 TaxID=2854030 RepID=UPI001CD21CA7|nr:bifunctional UDP-N-acetylglucosamine diphosphorylase/glucosamine-1-phosphate N-acetyltransferase GlmU [Cognatishimia sp. MH4019]
MATALILLAAGKGTRMQSDLPKVLHEIGNAPLLHHAMQSAAAISPTRSVVVTGHGAEAVKAAAQIYDPEVDVVLQTEQLGTAHAVEQARTALAGFEGDAIVLFGDTPFIQPETLEAMLEARTKYAVVVLGFEAADPARYGRLVTQGDTLERIVEYNEASDEERAITLCNSGVIAADCNVLFELLSEVGNDNAAGEYYLTDIPELAHKRGLTAGVVRCDEAETLGINSRAELAQAEGIFQTQMRRKAMEDGVALQAPETVQFSADTVLGRDSVIEPNVVFAPGVTVETGARIRAFSHLEGCHVARGAVVGPYARLRPGTELSEDVKIGNFVELKNATLAEGAKVNHLSYIGDAQIGASSNIGAGTITCNYDGVLKHQTEIGARVFVGSNTMLVAPVKLGDDAMTASGSVITRDVPATDLAVARARQENKSGFAVKLFEKLKAIKAKRQKDGS